jgi:hypothetical protein
MYEKNGEEFKIFLRIKRRKSRLGSKIILF